LQHRKQQKNAKPWGIVPGHHLGGIMYRNFACKELLAIVPKVKSYMKKRSLEIKDNGKIAIRFINVLHAPWIYISQGRFKYCSIWQLWEEWFPKWEGEFYVPSGCQKCWKVVIRPQTVFELFQLYEILHSSHLPSKCGEDVRPWTKERWGGFIYADSQEQGHEYKNLIEPIVRQMVGGHVADTIHLKRGCTEYDRKQNSNEWFLTPAQEKLEMYLNDIFIHDRGTFGESPFSIASKKQTFIERANSIGDLTWKMIPGLENHNMTVDCVTYNRQEEAHYAQTNKGTGESESQIGG
jgi:type IV secretory pathway VirB4 component